MKANEKGTCDKEKVGEDFPLESSWKNLVGEKEKGGKEKEKKKESGMRSSTFSLGSTEIGLSVFVGARGKVHLRNKSFT